MFAREHGLYDAANGIRGLRTALAHWAREDARAKAKPQPGSNSGVLP
jgi:hypothetical protein